MDIQKEKEAFEAWFESRYGAHFMQFALDLDFYVDKHTQTCWEAWQAKAQAVPEGFVLVPKEIPKSFDEGLYFYSNSISVVNEHSDGFIPMSDIDHSEIWKLVIEAQEPTND